MKDFKNMSDSTVLRVKVPKALYESIKKELEKQTINETVNVEESEKVEEAEAAPVSAAPPVDLKTGDSAVDAMLKNPVFSRGITAVNNVQEITKVLDAIFNGVSPQSKPLVLSVAKAYIAKRSTPPKGGGDISHFASASKPKDIAEDSVSEESVQNLQEVDPMSLTWIPAALAGVGLGAAYFKDVIKHMKEKGLKGKDGFAKAAKEVGSETASAIDRSMGTTK